jgi:hypothetical protein
VQISVEGEDETIAAAYIRKEIGMCPQSFDLIEEGSTLKGYISKISTDQITVDIGVFEPKVTHAAIPLDTIRSQLIGRKEISLKALTEIYGLIEGFPLSIKILSKTNGLQAELSLEQEKKFKTWQQSLLDRLLILRASETTISSAIERTRLSRDIIDTEKLGLFEYVLTCKLGTDARGLISRLGRYMRYAIFAVSSPKRHLDLVADSFST